MEPWRQEKRKIALIRKMQELDSIRNFLSEKGPTKSSAIASACRLGQQRALMLLNLLVATGEIKRIGSAFQARYILNHTNY
jgi:hypothetical protein